MSSAAPRLSPLRCRVSDCANFSLQLDTSNVSCARVADQRCCGSTVDVQCAQETNATCCAATRIDVSGDQDSLTPFSWTLRCSSIAKSRFQKSANFWICLSHSWPAPCWNTTRPPATRPISTRYDGGVDVFLLTRCEVAWFKPLSRADA